MPSIREIVQALDARAPLGTAEDWDNVGLLAGDPDWKTSGAVVSVDLTAQAIEAARAKGYRLIVNHHPCIFPRSRGLSRVIPGAGGGGLVFEAIQHGIAVAAYHTNFDRSAMEVVQAISEGLGVQPKGRLLDRPRGSVVKLVVFVPAPYLNDVRAAIAEAGAGHIGNYDSCTFGTPGEGTFRGGDGAQPFLGQAGQLETAQEIRLETVFPKGMEKPVLQALLQAHPYEEVAYDLYPVEQAPATVGLVRGLGYGFWGDFPESKSFSEVSEGVRSLFKVNGFMMTQKTPRASKGRAKKYIRRIGFAAGKGASFVDAAVAAGCDLFVTGEVGYHSALDGSRRGMSVIELGHRESELFFLQTMRRWLSRQGLKVIEQNFPTQQIVF